jgi:hypothetical protein
MDNTDLLTPKQKEVTERRARVLALLKLGVAHEKIAEQEKVTRAVITKDAKYLKAKKLLSPQRAEPKKEVRHGIRGRRRRDYSALYQYVWDHFPVTNTDVAKAFNLSRERVRQILHLRVRDVGVASVYPVHTCRCGTVFQPEQANQYLCRKGCRALVTRLTPEEVRRKFSGVMQAKWDDPEWRATEGARILLALNGPKKA